MIPTFVDISRVEIPPAVGAALKERAYLLRFVSKSCHLRWDGSFLPKILASASDICSKICQGVAKQGFAEMLMRG
jgi:hypothetical protein